MWLRLLLPIAEASGGGVGGVVSGGIQDWIEIKDPTCFKKKLTTITHKLNTHNHLKREILLLLPPLDR